MNVRYFINSFGYTALAANREARLFRRNRIYIDPTATAVEPHATVNEREDCIIATEADIFSRQKLGAPLADYDVTCEDRFASKSFYAEAFANAVAAVFNTALSFFMSHWGKLSVDG